MLATQSPIRPDRVFRFGPFELAPHLGELRRNCRRVQLQNQPMLVLIALLEHPGQLVTREVLHRTLWPADTFVDFDMGLNTAVRKLRQALGDSAERPRYIETHSRRGYRFIAPVTCTDFQSEEAVSRTAELPNSKGPQLAPVLLDSGWEIGTLDVPLSPGKAEQPAPVAEEHVLSPAPLDSEATALPASNAAKVRRFRRFPLIAARATGALLLVALLLAALLLVGLLTLWRT